MYDFANNYYTFHASEFMAVDSTNQSTLADQQRISLWNIFQQDPDFELSFSDDFEVLQLDYFRQMPILNFLDALTQSGGIFQYGWSLKAIRFVTLALLADSSNIFIDETNFGSYFSDATIS